MNIAFATTFFGALFAIMNPFVTLPVFLSMTEGMSVSEQRSLAIKVVLFSLIMCVLMSVAGHKVIIFLVFR